MFQKLDALDWRPIKRSYSNGISSKRSIASVEPMQVTILAGTEQTLPGQTDIYPYSYPSIANIGEDLIVIWITDDMTKTGNNRTSLVFSKYVESQWSTSVKVAEDGTADFYPQVAAMTGGAMAVWQDSGMIFDATATMADMLPQQEISVSRYDGGTNSWGTGHRLTQNSYLDRSPDVAASGDKAIAAWISNSQDSMLGSSEEPNQLNYAHYNGTEWSGVSAITTGIGAIITSDLSYNGSEAVYVYAVDADADLSTVEDQDLYAVTYDGANWFTPVRLMDDAVQDANPRLAYDTNGNLMLLWYKDGDFMMTLNLDMAASKVVVAHELSSGAGDFRLASGENGQIFIVWPDASSQGQDIFMSMYDPNLNIWGKSTQVTASDSMERTLSAAQAADGSLMIVYNKVETLSEIRQVDVNGTLIDVEVPRAGRTDLCAAKVSIDGDLAVSADSISHAPEEIVPGGTIGITATIENEGIKGAENIAVDFYYGDPAADGELIGSRQTIVGPLAAGDSVQVTVSDWQIPDQPDGNKDIHVVVDPDLSYEDKDRGNNTAHISIFKPDLEIAQMFTQNMGPVKRGITVTVKNTGSVSAADIPVVIQKEDVTGPALHQETLESLAPDESIDVVYDWDTSDEQPTEGYLQVYAAVNTGQVIPETTYLNNQRTIRVLGATPGEVTNPSIPDETNDVTLRPLLDWDDVPNATSYDLFLWKVGESIPDTPAVSGLLQSQYLITDELDTLSEYQWKVVARNSSGISEGPEWIFATKDVLKGDVNDDGGVDLMDAVLTLQIVIGLDINQAVYKAADVNSDNKIGFAEVIYIMQEVAGLRD